MTTFYLITTASEQSATDGTLGRLIRSVPSSAEVHLICVARGWRATTRLNIELAHGKEGLTILGAACGLSLSAARNLGLQWLRSQDVGIDACVAFPDDDCWYFPDTLLRVRQALKEQPGLSAVTGSYGPSEESIDLRRFPPSAQVLRAPAAVGRVSSVTLFVRAERALALGGFNPMLGAGTQIIAGEDTDFVLRLLEADAVVAYRPEVRVGHVYRKNSAISYAGPTLLVLASHVGRSPELLPTLLRSLIASVRERHRPKGSRRLGALTYLNPARIRAVKRAQPPCVD